MPIYLEFSPPFLCHFRSSVSDNTFHCPGPHCSHWTPCCAWKGARSFSGSNRGEYSWDFQVLPFSTSHPGYRSRGRFTNIIIAILNHSLFECLCPAPEKLTVAVLCTGCNVTLHCTNPLCCRASRHLELAEEPAKPLEITFHVARPAPT